MGSYIVWISIHRGIKRKVGHRFSENIPSWTEWHVQERNTQIQVGWNEILNKALHKK